MSTWNGIGVSGGRVISLDLGVNNLTGTIPAELGNLSNLEIIVLAQNTTTNIHFIKSVSIINIPM